MCWELIRKAARVVEADLPTWQQLVDQYHEWQVALTTKPVQWISPEMQDYMRTVVNMTEGRVE